MTTADNNRDHDIAPDYFSSRTAFVRAAEAGGAQLERFSIDARGPDDEQLTVDLARFGPRRARRQIIITSGVHGVEGFIGAAVQVDLMRRPETFVGNSDSALTLVHAVNPYGFSHLRRVNEDNVDINRNFVLDASASMGDSDRYRQLDEYLNPPHAPGVGSRVAFVRGAIRRLARRNAMASLRQTIAEGQFAFPHGLFFGGTAASQSVRILTSAIMEHAAGAESVLHLDLHSGLGPHGAISLFGTAASGQDEAVHAWAKKNIRRSVHLSQRASVATGPYVAQGTLGQWYAKTFATLNFLYLIAEFGTVSPLRILFALRDENQAHHHAHIKSPQYFASKQRLRRYFCPVSPAWRRRCLTDGAALATRVCNSEDLPR